MNPPDAARIGERHARATMGRAALLVVALLLVVAPAVAFANEGGHSLHGSPWSADTVLLVAAAGLGMAGAAARRARATAIVTLGLLVGIFGLEAAIHSVHHASDPQSAASCPLFSASQHTQSDGVPTPVTGIPTWTSEPSLALELRRVVPLAVGSPYEGRAPPALHSA